MEPMKPTDTEARREPLTRQTIVSAGMALADEQGVKGLTMRNIARQVGFEVMSLYNHVANKNELLTLMVDAVAGEIEPPPPTTDPIEAVRALAVSTRAALLEHPWAAELWLRHLPGPIRTDRMEVLLRTLAETGLSPELAHHGFHAVNNHVLGFTLQEQEMDLGSLTPEQTAAMTSDYLATFDTETHPHTVAHIHQHLEGESTSSFELVLDLILDGLVRLNEGAN